MFLVLQKKNKLQKEFLANKEKCSVKIIKKAPNKKENEINTNNLIFPTGEIKKKKGKKKWLNFFHKIKILKLN